MKKHRLGRTDNARPVLRPCLAPLIISYLVSVKLTNTVPLSLYMSNPGISWWNHNLALTVFPAKAGIQKAVGWSVYLRAEAVGVIRETTR